MPKRHSENKNFPSKKASSSSSSSSINSGTSKERLASLEQKFDNLFSLVNRFMKQSMNSSNNSSAPSCKRVADDSDTEDEDKKERSDTDSVPTDYQLSDTLLDQFKPLINNQGLLVEEECILKKSEISEMNKVFSFPSNFQVNIAPFGTPEGITASSTLKNNDADLFLSAIILHRVRRNNISKEIYGVVGGLLFHFKQVWKELGLPSFCQEVVSGLKVHVLPNLISAQHNTDINSRGSEIGVHYKGSTRLASRRFNPAIPKPGTNLLRSVLDLKRLNTFIANQSFKMEGIKNLPSMVKQGYYMVKLDIKKAYLHVLIDPHYRDLFRFVWKGVHYRWKTMLFGLSTAPRIITMLLRPVLRMLRELNVSVIAYLDDLLIVGSTKEECLSNLDKTMKLLVKLGFNLNLEKSVLEPTKSITFGINVVTCSKRKEEECHQRDPKLLQAKQLYSSETRYWDQPFVIPQDVKSEISIEWQRDMSISKLRLCSYNRCFRVRCRCNSKERKQDHQHMVIPVVSDSIKHVIESSRDARSVNGLPSTLSESPQLASQEGSVQSHSTSVRSNSDGSVNGLPSTLSESPQLQAEDSTRQHNNSLVYQSPRWSNPGFISPLRTTLEAVSQEESQLDWRALSRVLQCQSRVESQVVQDDQELQLATQE
ncbi:hypothetical protein ACTFIU_005680 [Dictyostelium citrinum]